MSAESRPTVLVVEDEQSLADIYATWLRGDYDVRVAYDGEEALDQLDDSVHIVLLDRRMPHISGDNVLDEIEARGLDCRVAMVTAVQPDVDIVELGFDDYLMKPVSKEDLHGLVESLVNRAAYDRQMQEYFALVSKKATLESEGSSGIQSSDEYSDLESQVSEVRSDLDASLDEMDDEDFTAVLRSIGEDRPLGDNGE